MNNNLSLQPSAYEQYMLELINRARSNPNAEAGLYSLTDLNQGLSPGTITSDPKQPLAFNLFLIDSARSLSGLWKADVNYAKFPLFRINWEKAHQQQIYRN